MVDHGDHRCHRQNDCRRPECMEAWRKYKKYRAHEFLAGRPAFVDATGTRRRLQGLACLGYSTRFLALQVGRPRSELNRLHRVSQDSWVRTMVRVETYWTVKELYDRYSMTPAPDNRFTSRVRSWARTWGFAPPLAWDDGDLDNPAAVPKGAMNGVGFCGSGRHRITPESSYYPPSRPNQRHCRDCRRERKQRGGS